MDLCDSTVVVTVVVMVAAQVAALDAVLGVVSGAALDAVLGATDLFNTTIGLDNFAQEIYLGKVFCNRHSDSCGGLFCYYLSHI